MINLAQLTAMLGEDASEQQAVLAWTGDKLGTEWTDEQAAELVEAWHNTNSLPWEQHYQELTYDECEAIGLDGSGVDGNPRFPYTEEKLTQAEAAKLKAYREGNTSAGYTG